MFSRTPSYSIPTGKDFKTGVFVSCGALVWESKRLGETITVPSGTPTNFANIPLLARPLIPVNGRTRHAAALHDYLYSVSGKIPLYVDTERRTVYLTLTRDQCDLEMIDAMRASGVRRWVISAIRAGLKVGGWVVWNKIKKERAS